MDKGDLEGDERGRQEERQGMGKRQETSGRVARGEADNVGDDK